MAQPLLEGAQIALVQPPLREPPAQPAPAVRNRMNSAAGGFVNDLDGYKIQPMSGGKECHQEFRFDFKMIRDQREARDDFEIEQTKSALRIWQRNAG